MLRNPIPDVSGDIIDKIMLLIMLYQPACPCSTSHVVYKPDLHWKMNLILTLSTVMTAK